MKVWILSIALGAASLGLIGLCQADAKSDAPPGQVKTTKLVIKDMT